MTLEQLINYVKTEYSKQLEKKKIETSKTLSAAQKSEYRQYNFNPPLIKKGRDFYIMLVAMLSVLLPLGLPLGINALFPVIPTGITGIFGITTGTLISAFSVFMAINTESFRNCDFKTLPRAFWEELRHGNVCIPNQKTLQFEERKKAVAVKTNELYAKYDLCKEDLQQIERIVEDLSLCREMYQYLIPEELKQQILNIDINTLETLLKDSKLSAILYKYYRGELDEFISLSQDERVSMTENISSQITGEIEGIKRNHEKQMLLQKRQEILARREEYIRQQAQLENPNGRIRRTERRKAFYPQQTETLENQNEDDNHIRHSR